jgi:hypothetical protein
MDLARMNAERGLNGPLRILDKQRRRCVTLNEPWTRPSAPLAANELDALLFLPVALRFYALDRRVENALMRALVSWQSSSTARAGLGLDYLRSISPGTVVLELRAAVAMLQFNGTKSPRTKARPVLRVIEGGLSRA